MGGPGFTGQKTIPDISDQVASRIVISGSITYVAVAPPGTSYTNAKWSVRKIDETDPNDVKITWAVKGGVATSRFVHKANDLASLTYA